MIGGIVDMLAAVPLAALMAGVLLDLLWVREGWALVPHTGSVRGVDIFRVQDGKVAEKLSYVKG